VKKITLLIILIVIGVLLFAGCNAGQNYEAKDSLIENSSMENVDIINNNMPQNWSYNSWGNNKASFTYMNKGHFGRHSVKTEIKNYQSGDAKWFFEPITLPAGDYIFSSYYISNVDTRVVVCITDNEGKLKYIDLPNASASKKWTKYEATFSVPRNAAAVTVYHLLCQNGYLICDDYSIEPYKYEGFDQGFVTITFDDSWEDNVYTALPIMQEFGYRSTQFYTVTFIKNPRVPNPSELIAKFISAGHEIGSHSDTHPYLTTLTEKQLYYELAESKAYLQNYLKTEINYFASPYGAYNRHVNDNIMKHYTLHRTVNAGYNSKDNFDVSRISVQNVLSLTTADEIAEWVKKAKDEKLWLVLLYHKVVSDPGLYDTTPEMFYSHMQTINNSGIKVVTITEALKEINEE